MATLSNSLYSEALTPKLAKVSVLIADADRQIAALLRKILQNLGFGAVYLAKDGAEALKALRSHPIDLAITDWEMLPMDGLTFIRHMRIADESPNKRLPIIMLTGKAQRTHVEQARDAGMTEFVVKPFSVKTLCERLILVVEHPRNFILSRSFIGPDRRRHLQPPENGVERRTDISVEGIVVAENEDNKILRINDEDIVVVNPDFGLKNKIGKDVALKDIFSPESIRRAQQIITQASDDFMQWIVEDLKNMEAAYRKVERPEHTSPEVRELYSAALLIKARAGTFGYNLASQVAESLMHVLENCIHAEPARVRVARQHIDALYVIFQRDIQGAGGQTGKELMASLDALTRKYKDK